MTDIINDLLGNQKYLKKRHIGSDKTRNGLFVEITEDL